MYPPKNSPPEIERTNLAQTEPGSYQTGAAFLMPVRSRIWTRISQITRGWFPQSTRRPGPAIWAVMAAGLKIHPYSDPKSSMD